MLHRGKAEHTDPSALLSTYLLQGWVMTDHVCPVEECTVPLMRAKDKSLSFCVSHDTLPTKGPHFHYETAVELAATPALSTTESFSSLSPPERHAPQQQQQQQQQQQKQTVVPLQPFQTQPPRELTISEDAALMDRKQRVSELLGQKMLAQWALLNEVCPKPSCSTVPLVRHPRDKYLYCVVCQAEYDLVGGEPVPRAATKLPVPAPAMVPAVAPISPPLPPPKTEHKPLEHSPMSTPERTPKRPKKQDATPVHVPMDATLNGSVASAASVATERLANKLVQLTEQAEQCQNMDELAILFQAIKRCCQAIEACRKL